MESGRFEFDLFGLAAAEHSYRPGRTTSVSSVDEMIPPMTTVASGRWTSAPVPLARAIGTKPRDYPGGPERREALIELPSCGPLDDHDDKLIVLMCFGFKFLIHQVLECS